MLLWLLPGKDLATGLRAMVDDNSCLEMANGTKEGCVTEIYVEAAAAQDLSDDDVEQDNEYEDFGTEDEDDEAKEGSSEDAYMGSGKQCR